MTTIQDQWPKLNNHQVSVSVVSSDSSSSSSPSVSSSSETGGLGCSLSRGPPGAGCHSWSPISHHFFRCNGNGRMGDSVPTSSSPSVVSSSAGTSGFRISSQISLSQNLCGAVGGNGCSCSSRASIVIGSKTANCSSFTSSGLSEAASQVYATVYSPASKKPTR